MSSSTVKNEQNCLVGVFYIYKSNLCLREVRNTEQKLKKEQQPRAVGGLSVLAGLPLCVSLSTLAPQFLQSSSAPPFLRWCHIGAAELNTVIPLSRYYTLEMLQDQLRCHCFFYLGDYWSFSLS